MHKSKIAHWKKLCKIRLCTEGDYTHRNTRIH